MSYIQHDARFQMNFLFTNDVEAPMIAIYQLYRSFGEFYAGILGMFVR